MNAFARRTFAFELRPNRRQREALERELDAQRWLYNLSLQEWRDSYAWAKRLASHLGLTHPRKADLEAIDRDKLDPERRKVLDALLAWKGPSYGSQRNAMSRKAQTAAAGEVVFDHPAVINRWTLERRDLATQAFFDRVKKGDKAGYPRFRANGRWNTFGCAELRDAAFVRPEAVEKGRRAYGSLLLPGFAEVIAVRMHRMLPEGTNVRAATVTRRNGRWFVGLSARVPLKVGVETDEQLLDLAEKQVLGVDWGVRALATTCDGTSVLNPRSNKRYAAPVRRAQRKVARSKRGSKGRRKKVARYATLKRREANHRRTALRAAASAIVALAVEKNARVVAMEKLRVKNMVRSAKGTVENPGRNVRAKAGLNRGVLDAAPAAFMGYVRCKAESAGVGLKLVDPKNTSVRCSSCGVGVPKDLSVRVHKCACGARMDRDHNAAVNIARRAAADCRAWRPKAA